MTIKPELRQRVLKYIVLFRKWGQKVVAAMVGRKSVYYLLSNEDRPPIEEHKFEKTLAALKARPAHAAVTAAWLESMELLEQPDGPRPEERDAVELALVRESQQRRALFLEIARRLDDLPPLDGYPEPARREPLRWFARLQLQALKALETEEERLAVVQECREYQHWALMEAAADEASEAASRSVEESAFWARVAVESGDRARGENGGSCACAAMPGFSARTRCASPANSISRKPDSKNPDACGWPAQTQMRCSTPVGY